MNNDIDRRTIRRRLIRRIEAAFADAIYPGDENITNEHHCEECYEIAQIFKGKHWRDLTSIKFLNQHEDQLLFLKPSALQFFLPGFLLAHLQNDRISTDSVLFVLTPPQTVGLDAEKWFEKFGEWEIDYFIRKTKDFTPQQREVIKQYLEYYRLRQTCNFLDNDFKRAIAFWSEPV